MYNPVEFRRNQKACKGLRNAVVLLAIMLVITSMTAVLAIMDAHRTTNALQESEIRCCAAEKQVAYLNGVIDNMNSSYDYK